MTLQRKPKYGLKLPELAPNTRVINIVDGRRGKVAWLCIKACYRVTWDNGTVTQVHESQLSAEVAT